MATASAEPAFSRSLADFKKRLSHEDCERFSLTTFEDLRIAIDGIQREQGLRRGFRNLNKIKPFISTLQQYALVIEQFVNAKSDFLAFIWGSIKLCLQIASRVVEAFDCLLDAYARIGEALPIFSAVENLSSSHVPGHVQQTLANIYEDILKFHQRATVFFKQRAWTIAFKTTFRSFGDMFGDVVEKLRRSKELLIQTASVSEFQEAQNARLLIAREFEAQRERDEKEQRLSVVEWLSHVTCHSQHEELQERRRVFPSTTRWIFDTIQTREWFRNDDESGLILYVYGIPGAGKTFLFSSILDEIGERAPTSHVVYFYCKESDPSRRSFNEIARSLVGQLLALNPICLGYLYERALKSGERILNSTHLCNDILKSLTAIHEKLFIGIDGLDECDGSERRRVLDLIHGILNSSSEKRNVRIFLTSRKEKDIGESISSAIRLEIKSHHLEQDIKHYVQERVSELGKKFGLAMDEKERISEDVAKRSAGMFLLARLIMDNLIDQDFPDELAEELRSEVLPKGIDEAYGRILRRMNMKYVTKKSWGRARLGLDLLALAKRSIMPHEIQGAISICLETKSVKFQERRSVTPLAELLGPMVEIHADGSVNFIHPIARDYLLQEHSGRFIDMGTAHLSLAQLCTSYMTFNCFDRGLDRSAIEDAVTRGDYSFQEYAIFNWIHHVDYLVKHEKAWSTDETSSIKDSLELLCRYHLEQRGESPSSPYKNENNSAATDILGSLENLRRGYECTDALSQEGSHQGSVPYLVSRVVEVRRILEESSAELPQRLPILTEAYGKMLFKCPIISCTRFYQGFEKIELRDKHLGQHERAHKCSHEGCDYRVLGFPTEVELRRHVELCHNALPGEPTFPIVQRVNLSKALNDAIDRDDVQAVRDICSEISVCPLRQTGFILRAMKRRSISTAFVLVELLGTDIEMNHVDSKGKTVLHEAVQIRNDDLFDRILDTGITVDVRDRDGLTPFLTALQQGYFHAIRLLMNHAAVNIIPIVGCQGRSIYYKGMKDAAAAGVDDILKALLSKFVSVGKSDLKGRFKYSITNDLTRIIAKAALNRHESTVKLILELAHALDLESMYQGFLKNELHHGMEAMTTFLMQRYGEAKSEIGKNGKTYGNALANAAIKDDSALVMRLLKDGADIDYATPQLAYNALGAAASRGNLPMVSLLVEQGADINAKGGYSGNALYLACCKEHIAILDFFIERGADVNARLRNDNTALIKASSHWGKSLDAVQLLVGKAADVNLQNEFGRTALFEASQNGYKEIVEILVQGGADVNLQNTSEETALFEPSRRSYKEIVEILVQGGADINLQNESGRTALFEASQNGYKEIVEILVQGGADVNLQNVFRRTALIQASQNGHKEIVEILFKGGADVNQQDRSGETALSRASDNGYKEVVDILLQKGADISLQDERGENVLFAAFEGGKREVVRVLIKAEVDLEVTGSHQRTLLMQAAARGWEDIVQILIDKGADIDSVDADQQTALLIASKKGHVEVVRILLARGAKGLEAALSTAFINKHGDIVQLLLKQASRSHQRTAVQIFLQHVDVAGVYTPGGVYDYALSSACSFGLEECVKVLLEEGPELGVPVATYDKALGLIGSRRDLPPHEYEAIAKLLHARKVITVLPD